MCRLKKMRAKAGHAAKLLVVLAMMVFALQVPLAAVAAEGSTQGVSGQMGTEGTTTPVDEGVVDEEGEGDSVPVPNTSTAPIAPSAPNGGVDRGEAVDPTTPSDVNDSIDPTPPTEGITVYASTDTITAAAVGEVFTGKIKGTRFGSTQAEEIDCTFKILSEQSTGNVDGTVQLGAGSSAAIDTGFLGTIELPGTVAGDDRHEGKVYSLVALAPSCFEGCSVIDITYDPYESSRATLFGARAFANCTRLVSTGLASNSTVTTLGDNCFKGCTALTTTGLATNSKMTTLGTGCFEGCTGLSETGLATNQTIVNLGNDTFKECTGLSATGLANNSKVTTLGDNCFYGCTGLTLTGLATNSTATTLGGACFFGCTRLSETGLATNSTVTTLGNGCFDGCIGLTATGLATNTSISTLPAICFHGCRGLTETGLATNTKVTSLGVRCFGLCAGLTDTGLATNSKVTTLGERAFIECDALTDTGLAANTTVTTIGDSCFAYCGALRDAALPSSLTSLSPQCFYTSGQIAETCTKLDSLCFYGSYVVDSANLLEFPESKKPDAYHLASNTTWAGKTAADVSSNCNALLPLYKLTVTGGHTSLASASSINHWATREGTASADCFVVGEQPTVVCEDAEFARWTKLSGDGTLASPTQATTTFQMAATAAEIRAESPAHIEGDMRLTLEHGYEATSSNAFTITGSPAPTVTKTSGDAAITWNDTTKKLDIAPGLTSGTYSVGLTAENGVGESAQWSFEVVIEYRFLAGENSVWQKKSGTPLTLTVDGEYTKLQDVSLDGNPIAPSNYTSRAGSTVITLKPTYLETLAVGEHTLSVNFTDGFADTTLTVQAAPTPAIPKTGESGAPYLWSALLLVSGCMLATTAALRGRRSRRDAVGATQER